MSDDSPQTLPCVNTFITNSSNAHNRCKHEAKRNPCRSSSVQFSQFRKDKQLQQEPKQLSATSWHLIGLEEASLDLTEVFFCTDRNSGRRPIDLSSTSVSSRHEEEESKPSKTNHENNKDDGIPHESCSSFSDSYNDDDHEDSIDPADLAEKQVRQTLCYSVLHALGLMTVIQLLAYLFQKCFGGQNNKDISAMNNVEETAADAAADFAASKGVLLGGSKNCSSAL